MRFITKEDMNALTEINHIIRDICSNKLHIQYKERLETNIVQRIWKLEMILPSSFFDLMKHLPIHLSFKVEFGGLIQYKWMYPFERSGITHAL
jgi:hypothetical protein